MTTTGNANEAAAGPTRVLVTGGGGFLGKAIVRRLVVRGDQVRSISRRRYAELDELGVEQIRGDIADAAAAADACRGVSVVLHTAAKAGVWGRAADFARTNVTGTRNILAACREKDIRAFVYTSSPSVIFDGTDMEGVNESVPYPKRFHAAYPQTKARAEQAVLAAARQGLTAVILRPHLIWGPGDPHFVPRIVRRARSLRRVGDGTKRVDTIYIDNAADAHILAADRLLADPGLSGRVYFISQNDPIPLWDMVDGILQAAGCSPVQGSLSPRLAWLAGTVLELVYRLLPLKGEPRMTRFLARELATAHWFDTGAARRDLGFEPAVSTEEGLRRLAQWLKTYPNTD
jgi:nucleoside-diphosphate-sugar epimerase